MKRSELEKLLSQTSHNTVTGIFRDDPARATLLFKTAASVFTDDEVPRLDELIASEGFTRFLKARKRISIQRLKNSLDLLFRRLAAHIPADTVALAAGAMCGEKYTGVERSFFRVPPDIEGFEFFEKGLVRVAEQNLGLVPPYLDFFSSENYVYMRALYRDDPALFMSLIARLVTLLLSKKSVEPMLQAADYLRSRDISWIIFGASLLGKGDEFLDNFFSVLIHAADSGTFIRFLSAFGSRFRGTGSFELQYKLDYPRLAQVWSFAVSADAGSFDDYKEFLSRYGSLRDEFEKFIWDMAFSLPPERTGRAMTILVSPAFNSLQGFYSNDMAIVKFLVKNIIAALSEMNIRDLTSPLYSVALKLLLGLKVSRNFIKRRAEFFAWMKGETSSVRLEMEIIRFMFFEYIYIALKLVPNVHDIKMTRFCDAMHRFFVEHIDIEYTFNNRARATTDRLGDYRAILEKLRHGLWAGVESKFNRTDYLLARLRSISESTDFEDEILYALEVIGVDELDSYMSALMEVFRTRPDSMSDAVLPDYWYRVMLVDAMPFCQSVLISLVGTIEIRESEGGVYTNGRAIFLPEYINYFRDPLEPLIENRNLTVFIGFTLHEAGHIVAGTYHFDITPILEKVENPGLFRFIVNVFEDFRIEKFLVLIKAHYQVETILATLNCYFTAHRLAGQCAFITDFMLYIFDEAAGCTALWKGDPAFTERVDAIMAYEVNTGRFRGLREMADYGIERLRNIDVSNPLAVHPLAREFYEIIKNWPELDLDEYRHKNPPPECMAAPGGGSGPSRLTEEELQELYKRYNDNPRSFYEERGMPCPSFCGGEEAPESDGGNDPYGEFLQADVERYTESGTIDFSTRTRADDELAKNQLEGEKEKKGSKKKKKPGKKLTKGREENRKKKDEKKKYIYSIDSKTGGRTRLSEVVEYTLRRQDNSFLKRMRKWEYLSDLVYRQLSVMLPSVDEDFEISSSDGEIDVELLIEILADKKLSHIAPEFFELYIENKRSLEVAIGLDASGSTSIYAAQSIDAGLRNSIDHPDYHDENDTILDIEKVFAIIFGRALSFLTENVRYYAFNSITSTNVYRAETVEAVSSFKSDAANRDGDFIRYVSQELHKSPAEVKYFFLLSDGQPSAENYDGKEALDDTLIAMRETVNSGIKLIYFNFDLVKRDYFDLFQKEATFARYFQRPDEILSAIPEMIRTVVNSIR